MTEQMAPLPARKRIALIAHDERKGDLLAWARLNRDMLAQHELLGTGTTGTLLAEALDLEVTAYMTGPLGGDQQIGAKIAQGEIDLLIFFWDPLESNPHDPDVRALLRMAALQNIPTADNRSTADFLFSSPLMTQVYAREVYDYPARLAGKRHIDLAGDAGQG